MLCLGVVGVIGDDGGGLGSVCGGSEEKVVYWMGFVFDWRWG